MLTPDLSQEFHPQPKQYKTKKPPKKLGAGQKTKSWVDIREELKKEFAAMGITECEAHFEHCWKNNALSFGHLDKRRFLTKEDLKTVVLLCSPCHAQVEVLPREEMRKILQAIIDSRQKTFS